MDTELKIRINAITEITKAEFEQIIIEDTWYVNGGFTYFEYHINDEVFSEELDNEKVTLENIKNIIKEKIEELEIDNTEEIENIEYLQSLYYKMAI